MQVKERQESRRLGKGLFPWQMILFVTVLTVTGVCSLLLEKPAVSEMEQRELAKKPEASWQNWFRGSFSQEFDAYYADTFPLRDVLVSFSNSMKESLGFRHEDVRILGGTDAPVDAPVEPVSQSAPAPDTAESQNGSAPQESGVSSGSESKQEGGEDDIGVEKSGIFIYKGMGMSLFGGNESVGKAYAENINAYHTVFGDSVRVFDLVAPTSAEFYLPEKYKSLSHSEQNAIQSIYSHLAAGVTGVDAYSAIAPHTDEYLYFNTDHHWTGRGAYYAYTAFAKAAGFQPLDIETDYTIKRIDNFLGSLYRQTQDSKMREKGDYVEYFIPQTQATASIVLKDQPYTKSKWVVWEEGVSGGNGYLVFLCGDAPMIQIDTGNHNGKSIVVVKESYGNAFVPFLIPHYEHIYVVDERYFQTSLVAFIQENQVDDLLFLNNAFSAMTSYHANNLSKIMYQVYVPPEEEPEESQVESSQEEPEWQGIQEDNGGEDDEDE
ncbi:MAG: DHHW family protein [Oscillospiraceae bacterium]|nr:DHHW family protein [Oscillospiraceae bacterium]